jgi:hypothetical protein
MKLSHSLVLSALLMEGASAFSVLNSASSNSRTPTALNSFNPNQLGAQGLGGVKPGVMTQPDPGFKDGKKRSVQKDKAMEATIYPSEGVMAPLQQLAPTEKVSSALAKVGTDSADADLDALEMFTEPIKLQRMEGGGSIRTFKMPPNCQCAQMIFTTDGRPLKIKGNMWLGPLRSVHEIEIDSEDGRATPYRSTIKFKPNTQPTFRIQTTGSAEFPVYVGVSVPTKERSKEIDDLAEFLFDNVERTKIQGGQIYNAKGGPLGKATGGAVKIFNIPYDIESVSVMVWSRDVGKKSFKVKLEMLQGPNNSKQTYDLQCGGGSQPYHTIIQNPGDGSWSIRMYNKKFVEDGLFEVVVVPNEPGTQRPMLPLRSIPAMNNKELAKTVFEMK